MCARRSSGRGKERSYEDIRAEPRARHGGSDVMGPLSRSGSTDLYSTIPDLDSKLTRKRSSSDVTPVSSHPDLRLPDMQEEGGPKGGVGRPVTHVATCPAQPLHVVPKSGRDDVDPFHPNCPPAVNLLTFSDGDVSQTADRGGGGGGGGRGGGATSEAGGGSRPDLVLDSKAALIDFFVNDATFHGNPMVTGQLQPNGNSCVTQNVTRDPDILLETYREAGQSGGAGWAVFSDPRAESAASPSLWPGTTAVLPHTQTTGAGETPVATAGAGAGLPATGITAKVEGVYIDMRGKEKREEDGEEEGVYVAPGNQALADFLLLQ